MNGPEQLSSGEVKIGAVEAASKQAEKLRQVESSAEQSPEKNGEQLVADARKETEAIFTKEAGRERRSGGEPSASAAAIRTITKREKQKAYRQTLARVQSEMSAPARTFSKIIHAPVVEKASEIIGSTAARPNALLFGSIVSLVALTTMYAIGRTYGYHLSGFEMIGAYTLGWVLGLTLDYIRVLTSGKTS